MKDYLLVEMDVVHSTEASAVIPKLDEIFLVYGIPDIMISDNGPPFNGTDYKRCLQTLGITTKFSTLLWLERNAQAERFMKCLQKVLQTAKKSYPMDKCPTQWINKKMSTEKAKRPRKPNFSPSECTRILQLAKQNLQVIRDHG